MGRTLLLAAAMLFTIQPGVVQAGTARLKKAEIVDATGFEQPMTAATLLIPSHWQTQGGVIWNGQAACSADATRFEWAAYDANGTTAVQLIPGTSWQWSNLPTQYQSAVGCPTLQISNVRQYLEMLVAQHRPGASIVDYRDRADLTAEFKSFNQRTPMPMGEIASWVEAGEVLIGYRYQGVDTREVIQVVVVFNTTRMSDTLSGMASEFLSGVGFPAFAMRAPDGELDFRLLTTIQQSINPDPQWQSRFNAHQGKIARINLKGATERANMTRQTNNEINQMLRDSYEYRQRVMDQSHDRFSRYIRDVEVYNDPLEGRVELPSSYERAWRLDNGEYLMADDPNFDPYRDLGVNGTELKRTP